MKIDIDCDCEIKNVCCANIINQLRDIAFRYLVEHNRGKSHGHIPGKDGKCAFYCRDDREDRFITQCIYKAFGGDDCNEWCKEFK